MLKYQLLNERLPGFKENGLLLKLDNYHKHRDDIKYHDKAYPEQSRSYLHKQFLATIGEKPDDQNAAITEQEKHLMDSVRTNMEELKDNERWEHT